MIILTNFYLIALAILFVLSVSIYSTKNYNSLLYKSDIDDWIRAGHIISLTQEPNNDKKFRSDRVTKILQDFTLNDNSIIFMCGPISLVNDVRKVLTDKNFNLENVYASLAVDALHGGPVYCCNHPIFESIH